MPAVGVRGSRISAGLVRAVALLVVLHVERRHLVNAAQRPRTAEAEPRTSTQSHAVEGVRGQGSLRRHARPLHTRVLAATNAGVEPSE